MKVAQYEVLGTGCEKKVAPSRSGRSAFLKCLTQHFVLGYFRRVPPGQHRVSQTPLAKTRLSVLKAARS